MIHRTSRDWYEKSTRYYVPFLHEFSWILTTAVDSTDSMYAVTSKCGKHGQIFKHNAWKTNTNPIT